MYIILGFCVFWAVEKRIRVVFRFYLGEFYGLEERLRVVENLRWLSVKVGKILFREGFGMWILIRLKESVVVFF